LFLSFLLFDTRQLINLVHPLASFASYGIKTFKSYEIYLYLIIYFRVAIEWKGVLTVVVGKLFELFQNIVEVINKYQLVEFNMVGLRDPRNMRCLNRLGLYVSL
jgi:hypothetical protein